MGKIGQSREDTGSGTDKLLAELARAPDVVPQVSLVGKMLGRYRIDAILGRGGMGTVYRATDGEDREFAVKVLNADVAIDTDIRARFVREGYAASAVRHEGIVAVVDDAVAEDGSVFMVMELLHGTDVDHLRAQRGGRLDLAVVLAVIDGLLDVLGAAHDKGIIHRDVKPANVFLTTAGVVKVLDFGIARARATPRLEGHDATRTGVRLGTPAFMAPEQARGAPSEIDARTDLWAVGATMFMLLSASTVHVAESVPSMLSRSGDTPARPLRSVCPELDEGIAAVVDRALAFERTTRWPTASAMRAALREAAARANVSPFTRHELGAVASADVVTVTARQTDDTRLEHERRLTPEEAADTCVDPTGPSPPSDRSLAEASFVRRGARALRFAVPVAVFAAAIVGVAALRQPSPPWRDASSTALTKLPSGTVATPSGTPANVPLPATAASDTVKTDFAAAVRPTELREAEERARLATPIVPPILPNAPSASASSRPTSPAGSATTPKSATRRAIDEEDPYAPAAP